MNGEHIGRLPPVGTQLIEQLVRNLTVRPSLTWEVDRKLP